MGRIHEFLHGGRLCRRWEIDGEPEVETQTRQDTTEYGGKEYPTEIVIWDGLHRIFDGKQEWLVDRSTVMDRGKLGVTLMFTEHSERTEAARRAARERLDRAVRLAFPGWRLAPETVESA